MRKSAVIPLALASALFIGCTVRTTSQPDSLPAQPQKVGDAAKSVPLDSGNIHLAEVKVPLERLGSALRVIAKYDAHMTWDETFVRETVTEAKWLANGERLEGEMVASSGEGSYQLKIVIIRVSEKEYALRGMTSDAEFSKKLDQDLKKI